MISKIVFLCTVFFIAWVHYPYTYSGTVDRSKMPTIVTAEVKAEVLYAEALPDYSALSPNNVIYYSNQTRLQFGQSPLSYNYALNNSSGCKLFDMLAYHYWAHSRPGKSLESCFNQAGVYYGGENLAKCYWSSFDVIEAWLASPAHRANLLNPYWSRIGVSIGYDPIINCYIVVQHLG